MSSNIVALSDDAARSAIGELCIRDEPAESKKSYSVEDWEREFERPWVLVDERYLRTSTEVVGSGKAIYCRMCVQPKKHGKVAAFKLHVSYEEDVMGVHKRGLIRLQCNNCNFDMVTPRKPKVIRADFESFDESSKIDARIMGQLANKYGAAQQAQSAAAIGIQREEALNRLRELVAQGYPQEHLQQMADALARQQQDHLAKQVAPRLIYKENLDPNKWPGV